MDVPRHVLLVCSRPRRPSADLLGHPAIGKLSVVTEHGYVHDYGPGVAVATVEDIGDPEQVRRAAAHLFAGDPADAVLAPYETGLPSAGYVRSHYGLLGPKFDTVNFFTNKDAMKRRLAAAGLPVAAYRTAHGPDQVRAAAGELGWPCVVKPAFGGGSKGVAVIADPEALELYLRAEGALSRGMALLVEEHVPMAAEYHCDAVVEDGEPVFATASRYFGPPLDRADEMTGSYLLPGDHPECGPLLDLHREAVAVLGLEAGVTHLEIFRTADGRLLLSEIACRPAGGGIPDMIKLHHGVDMWDVHVRTSVGEPPALPGDRPVPRTYAVNLLLPIRPGVITALTSEQELATVEGVRSVRMLNKVGDVVPEELYSASATGFVQAVVPAEEDVATLVETLRSLFTLRTEPAGSAP